MGGEYTKEQREADEENEREVRSVPHFYPNARSLLRLLDEARAERSALMREGERQQAETDELRAELAAANARAQRYLERAARLEALADRLDAEAKP